MLTCDVETCRNDGTEKKGNTQQQQEEEENEGL